MRRPRETSPVQIPSRFHVFECVKEHFVCHEREHVSSSSQSCAIYIDWLDDDISKTVLQVCRRITQKQQVTDLWINLLRVHDIQETGIFTMGPNTQSLVLYGCSLPKDVWNNVLRLPGDSSTIKTLDLSSSDLKDVMSLNLNTMTSLTRLYLSNSKMTPELTENICKELRCLVHLEYINLWRTRLGSNGIHIAESIKMWAPDPPLLEFHLWDCALSPESSVPLLASMNLCSNLVDLRLVGNTFTGSISKFIPDSHPGLLFLNNADFNGTKLNEADMSHITRLIETGKLPALNKLDLRMNSLYLMEPEVSMMIEACIVHHHRELNLGLGLNNLSQSFEEGWTSCCEMTNVTLTFGFWC